MHHRRCKPRETNLDRFLVAGPRRSWRFGGPTTEELITRLLESVEDTFCGKDAAPEIKKSVEVAARELEKRNVVRRPTDEAVAGTWKLIYTTESSVHSFLAVLPVRGIYQRIDLGENRVQNRIQCAWNSCIEAEAPLSIVGSRRISYYFDLFSFKILGISVRVSPGKTSPGGWQDTTYVDADYKIVRNSQSDLLIMAKVK